MTKRMVHCYSTYESINQFEFGYIIKPSINCNKVFREQVEKFSSVSFYKITIKTIIYFLRKKNTCVMALIMFYENNGEKTKKVYKVLSCVIYSLIDNYVCIDYLSCQKKIKLYLNPKQHLNKQVSIYYSVLAFQKCY